MGLDLKIYPKPDHYLPQPLLSPLRKPLTPFAWLITRVSYGSLLTLFSTAAGVILLKYVSSQHSSVQNLSITPHFTQSKGKVLRIAYKALLVWPFISLHLISYYSPLIVCSSYLSLPDGPRICQAGSHIRPQRWLFPLPGNLPSYSWSSHPHFLQDCSHTAFSVRLTLTTLFKVAPVHLIPFPSLILFCSQ